MFLFYDEDVQFQKESSGNLNKFESSQTIYNFFERNDNMYV